MDVFSRTRIMALSPRFTLIIIIIIGYHYDLHLLTLHNIRHHFDALLLINVFVALNVAPLTPK